MIDMYMKQLMEQINFVYEDNKYTMNKFFRVRKMIAEYLVTKFQGVVTDEDYQYAYFLGNKIMNLVEVTNQLIKKRKDSNEEMIYEFNKYVEYLNAKKNRIMNSYGEISEQVVSMKNNTKNKIKVMFEDDHLSLFFDPIQFKDYEEELEDFIDDLEIEEPKKIESIGMLSGNIINLANNKDLIINALKDIVDSQIFDVTIVSDEEILINY